MPLKPFRTESLVDVEGGRVAAAIDKLLLQAAEDMQDRPADSRAREVTIKIKMTPGFSRLGDLEDCNVQFEVGGKTPSLASDVARMGVSKRNGLTFNADSPTNPSQTTIFDKEVNRDDSERRP